MPCEGRLGVETETVWGQLRDDGPQPRCNGGGLRRLHARRAAADVLLLGGETAPGRGDESVRTLWRRRRTLSRTISRTSSRLPRTTSQWTKTGPPPPREATGLSQEALAAAAELHRNYVGLLERGRMMPRLLVVRQLASALGSSMTEFIADVEQTGSVSRSEDARTARKKR